MNFCPCTLGKKYQGSYNISKHDLTRIFHHVPDDVYSSARPRISINHTNNKNFKPQTSNLSPVPSSPLLYSAQSHSTGSSSSPLPSASSLNPNFLHQLCLLSDKSDQKPRRPFPPNSIVPPICPSSFFLSFLFNLHPNFPTLQPNTSLSPINLNSLSSRPCSKTPFPLIDGFCLYPDPPRKKMMRFDI